MRKRAKRIYGILLSMSMLLTLLSVPAWAAEPVETGVGYELEHEHTQGCYTLTENCIHEHTSECCPQTTGTGTVSGNDVMETVEAQPTECAHVCSEESGCITKEWNCGYNTENNETPAAVGTTQGTGTAKAAEQETETVTVESVQAMIDALPDAEEISTNNAEEVAEQLEAIDKAKTKLSDEEIDTLDFTRYMKAAAALGELSVPMLTANGIGEVSAENELTTALADGSIPKITLIGNIDISNTLVINRAVTLDLNGCVLKMAGSGSVIQIKSGGSLIIEDKDKSKGHKFTPDGSGLWKLDENNGTKTIYGGVITGGTGTQVPYYGAKGGGVYIEPEGSLVMNGGSIVGCKANYGGGVQIEYDGNNKKYGAFVMNSGSIIVGCEAQCGGGVVVEEGCNFTMNSGSEIRYCTAKVDAYNTDGYGGGIMINGGEKPGVFTMNGGEIHNCTAGNYGGGIDNCGTFVMNGGQIHSCTAGNSYGGVRNRGLFIMSGGTIGNPNDHTDTSHVGNQAGRSVLTISGNAEIRTNVINGNHLNADGGEISGEVTNGIDGNFGIIMGSEGASGNTTFSGKVTNNESNYGVKSIIEKGIFTRSVTNNDGCKILGGNFSGATLSGNLEITYEPGNGDTDIIREVEWKNNGEKLTEPSLVKENYTIEGWYYDDNGTERKWDFGNDRTIYTMTLTAKWKPNIYTVKLEANGGTIANGKEVTNYTYGTDVTLPMKDDIIRKGYTFEGWYTDSGFSGSPVTKISSTDGGNKTFYAKWKQNTTPVTPVETEPKDTNHDNVSRNNTNSNNTDYYDTGDTNESSGTDPIIYPTLTFDTCRGSSIKAVRAFEGHTINLSGYLPTREGYQFSGWYADQNLTQPVTEIRLDGNRTVYAGWIKQAEQTGENSKPKAAPAQLIADDNTKTANKDSSQPLIEDYEPGSTDTSEDQITEDQATEGQSTEDTGDNQKPAVDNSSTGNDSKPDDSADLAPEKTSGNNVGILIACAFAGTALIGVIIYIIYRKGNKGRRL